MCADIHAHVDDCVIRYPAELLLLARKKEKKKRDVMPKKLWRWRRPLWCSHFFGGLCSDGRALLIFPSDIPTGQQHLFTFSFFLFLRKSKKKLRRSRYKFEITRVVRNFNQRHRQLCNSPPTEIVVVIQRRLTPFLPNSSGSCSRWVATAPQINQIVNGGRFEKNSN